MRVLLVEDEPGLVLTLVSIPKPFVGLVSVIQHNALRSWTALPGVEIFLAGDEQGAAEAAAEHGVEHLPGIKTNEHGTPLLDSALAEIEARSSQALRCFINADIILLDDFVPALERAATIGGKFLMIGRTTDLDVIDALALNEYDERADLAERARREGRSRGATAIDYFVFTPKLFDPVQQQQHGNEFGFDALEGFG